MEAEQTGKGKGIHPAPAVKAIKTGLQSLKDSCKPVFKPKMAPQQYAHLLDADGHISYEVSENYAFSRARVRVVRSQTSLGPKYWMAPG